MMGNYGGSFGNGFMSGGIGTGEIVVILFGVLVVAAIAALIVWAVRSSGGHRSGPPQA